MTGVEKTCPKGSSCISHSTMPGSEGVCIPDTECTSSKMRLDKMQDDVVANIIRMYENVFTPISRKFFKQVVNGKGGFVDCDRNHTCSLGSFCLVEPGSGKEAGTCYEYIGERGQCLTGVEGNCPTGEMCMAPPGSPPGAVGQCIPNNAKECTTGELKSCPKGFMCMAPPGSPPGSKGYCMVDDPCGAIETSMDYIQFWQLQDQKQTFYYDLDEKHKKILTNAINNLQ